MMESYRDKSGRGTQRYRRVDVASGRLISTAEPGSRRPGATVRWREISGTARLAITAAILVSAIVMLAGCATAKSRPAPAANSIEIESLRLTAAGHYIDLRYRVLDAERANRALGPGVKPLLIDEASGAVMAVPTTAKLGSLRQTRGVQRPDRSYFVLFVNSARLTPGSRVTAELGDMKFESLTIE